MNIVIFGESMNDHYEFYQSTKTDQTAPVPVIGTNKKSISRPGGADNVRRHLIDAFEQLDLMHTIYFRSNSVSEKPQKTRVYVDGHFILRQDWHDRVSRINPQYLYVDDADLVVISNYHKGLLENGYIINIINSANQRKIPVFVDTNVLGPEYTGAFCVKVNEQTARQYITNWNEEEPWYNALAISSMLDTQFVIITLGKRGAICSCIGKEINHIKDHWAGEYDVVDSIGAGDAFMAGLVVGWIEKQRMSKAILRAIQMARQSVKTFGTISDLNWKKEITQ